MAWDAMPERECLFEERRAWRARTGPCRCRSRSAPSITALSSRDAERAFVAQAEAAYGRFVSAWSERPKAKRPAPKRPGCADATNEERL